jgi:hypothetical protein
MPARLSHVIPMMLRAVHDCRAAQARRGLSAGLFTVAVTLLAACGGGSGDTPVTPPAQGTAASIAIQAGDNQSATAGASVAIAPSVLVRDQSAKPLAGVSVSFVADSGGGSVVNVTAISGADGVASSGGWTLGAGRNRLRATVGTLAPIYFIALASSTEIQAGTGTITSGGGTFTVARPGAPIDGMQIALPSGAVSGSLALTVSYGDSTGVPRKTGLRLASPVITIATSTGFSDKAGPVKITVPATLAATEFPVAILFNRLTGARMPIPAVRVSGTQVVLLARQLDGANLDVPVTTTREVSASVQGRTPHSRVGGVIQLVIGAITYTDLARDLTTGYTPALDDWEIDNVRTVFNPDAVTYQSGLAISAAWYFDHYSGVGRLNKKFQEAPGVEWSNPRGFIIGALTAGQVDLDAVTAYNAALTALAATASPVVTVDSLTLLVVKAGIFTTDRPYVLFADDPAGSAPQTGLLVYSTRNSTMNVSLGTSAAGINVPREMTLTAGRFAPVTWGEKDVESGAFTIYTLPRIMVSGVTSGIPASDLDVLWRRFRDNSIGNGVLPTHDIATREYRPVVDTMFVPDDTTRFWSECSGTGCGVGYTATESFSPRGVLAGGSLFSKLSTAAPWTKLGTGVRGAGLKVDSTSNGISAGLEYVAISTVGATRGRYAGWKQFTIKTKRLAVTSAPLQISGGFDFKMTATYNRPTPTGASWVWELGDGRTITTTVNTLTTQYPVPTAARDYQAKVTMKVGTVVEATGHITNRVNPPLFGWALTAANVTASTLPPGGIGIERSDTLAFNGQSARIARLTGTPGSTALFVGGLAIAGPTCDAAAFLLQNPSGAAADTLVSAHYFGTIASCGDPDYSGGLVLGTLGSGTLIGSAVVVPNPLVIVPPGGSITAAMSGRTLTGTFVLNVRYSTGIGTYTVAFTATQVRPQ